MNSRGKKNRRSVRTMINRTGRVYRSTIAEVGRMHIHENGTGMSLYCIVQKYRPAGIRKRRPPRVLFEPV